MGNKHNDGSREERSKLQRNDTQCNFALIGFPGAGKSSICNTVHRIITGRSETVNVTVKAARGTEEVIFLAEVFQQSNIKLFDTPGITLRNTETAFPILTRILRGVKVGTSIDQLLTPKNDEEIDDVRNKIDFVILVIDGTFPEKSRGLWTKDFLLEIRQLVKKETCNEPFVFITHYGQQSKKQSHFRKLFDVFPEGNIRCFDSYTSSKEIQDKETESKITSAFHTMLQRQRESDLLFELVNSNVAPKRPYDGYHSSSHASSSEPPSPKILTPLKSASHPEKVSYSPSNSGKDETESLIRPLNTSSISTSPKITTLTHLSENTNFPEKRNISTASDPSNVEDYPITTISNQNIFESVDIINMFSEDDLLSISPVEEPEQLSNNTPDFKEGYDVAVHQKVSHSNTPVKPKRSSWFIETHTRSLSQTEPQKSTTELPDTSKRVTSKRQSTHSVVKC